MQLCCIHEANQLKEAVETVQGGGTLSRTDSYAYDRNGNNLMKVSGYITDKKEGEEETGISGSSPYVTMYEYDSFGRLSKAETGGKKAEYSYDGNGVRRSKTVEGKTTGYYMAGDQVINETENGALSASNIIAGGVIGRITGGTSYMMLKNDHGDVVGLTANGEVKADYTYSAYGELIAGESNGINNPIHYAGEYTDEESGLIYLRARYYDPGLGRFISEDPIRDGANWYAFAKNNPIRYIDPTGLSAQESILSVLRAYQAGYVTREQMLANIELNGGNGIVLDVSAMTQQPFDMRCTPTSGAMMDVLFNPDTALSADDITKAVNIANNLDIDDPNNGGLWPEDMNGIVGFTLTRIDSNSPLNSVASGIDSINGELAKGNPILFVVEWAGGGLHTMVITGHLNIDGVDMIIYNDPWTGTTEMISYEDLMAIEGVRGSGTWTTTYTTQK